MDKAIYIFEKLAFEAEMEKIAAGATKIFEGLISKGKTEEEAYHITAQMLGHAEGDQKGIKMVKNQISAATEATSAKTRQYKMTQLEAKPGMNQQQTDMITKHNENISKEKTTLEKGYDWLGSHGQGSKDPNGGSVLLQGEAAQKKIERAKGLNKKIDDKAVIDVKTQNETPIASKYSKDTSDKAGNTYIKSQSVRTPDGLVAKDKKIVMSGPLSTGRSGANLNASESVASGQFNTLKDGTKVEIGKDSMTDKPTNYPIGAKIPGQKGESTYRKIVSGGEAGPKGDLTPKPVVPGNPGNPEIVPPGGAEGGNGTLKDKFNQDKTKTTDWIKANPKKSIGIGVAVGGAGAYGVFGRDNS